MCNEDGLVMAHGALLRLGEEDYLSYFLAPYAAYKFYTGGYNAQAEWVNDWFIFQVAGPRSLEVLEAATGECLHDIKFAHHRASSVNGTEVRISRMGMAGTLAYEVTDQRGGDPDLQRHHLSRGFTGSGNRVFAPTR
jgi:glycine cleavage system aminomethyltransferase T